MAGLRERGQEMKIYLGPYKTRRWYHRLFKLETPEPDTTIKIDRWDSWNADSTLAEVIHPVLIQLKNTTHGYPSPLADDTGHTDNDTGFERWKEILDKMIWSFEQAKDNYEGDSIAFTKCSPEELAKRKEEAAAKEDGLGKLFVSDLNLDKKVLDEYYRKVQEGFDLFGKYYMNLWD